MPPPFARFVLPSRCLRCGAVSRDPLCASCIDYLVAYRPLWLDPALLPGPSFLDLLGPRDIALVRADSREIEWRTPRREPTTGDAVRLVQLLELDPGSSPVMSVGDAEILHAFLAEAKQSMPADVEERRALASVYGYLSGRDWIPPHLAQEYRLRAKALGVPVEERREPPTIVSRIAERGTPTAVPLPSEPPVAMAPPPEPIVEPKIQPEPAHASETPLPAPEPEPGPEPSPFPEPPLPVPPTPVPPPEPQPEPEPEPEEIVRERAEEEIPLSRASPEPAPTPSAPGLPEQVDRERIEMESWVRKKAAEVEAKERGLVDREKALEEKASELAEEERLVTDRLVSLEKDEARREVLRFLAKVPGMTEDQADVIARAFPDMAVLRSADAKALAQFRGITDTLARAIRFELVPGEVEDEAHSIRLREEAQAFLEEGNYGGALDCYDRLLQERPEEKALWFDKAEVLVLLSRPEDALACYQRVIDLDRRSRQAWFERANLLFGMGRMADAVDSLKEALGIDPRRSSDILVKAEQLRHDGHANEAAILYQAVLDIDPRNGRAVLGLGDCFIDLGDIEAAEGLFTRALGAGGSHPEILFRRGELLNRKGRWGAAIQFYNRSIAMRWDYPAPWLAKGRILLDHGRPEDALECFDKVLSFDAANEAARGARSRAVAAMGMVVEPPEPPEAEPAPELPEELPEPSEAEDLLDEPIEEETEKPASGEKILADFKSFVDAVEPEREDTQVLVQLAELALEGGDARMALVRFEEALENDSKSSDAWRGKGTALQQLDKFQEALEAYDRALVLNPNDELAKRWRETCLRHLGRDGGS